MSAVSEVPGISTQALIQERGMDLDVLRGGHPHPHPPRYGGLPAEYLPVDKVSPPAHGLSNEQAHDPQVRESAEGELLPPAEDLQYEKCDNDRPVDSQPAIPDSSHLSEVQTAVRPAEKVQIK